MFDQIEIFNGIGFFIEDFIEYTRQFGMLDGERTGKMIDRKKSFLHHSINK